MKRVQLRDVSLLILAVVVVVLVVFAVLASLPPQSGPVPSDQYPFPQTSEFPTTTAVGRLAVEDAARFLRDVGWSSPVTGSRGWDFDGIEVLTLYGRRAGVYGLLMFDEPAEFPTDSGFVVCGEILEPLRSEVGSTSAMGLYIAMLDGRTQPSHVLPVTAEETLPQSRDLRWVGAGKCSEPALP